MIGIFVEEKFYLFGCQVKLCIVIKQYGKHDDDRPQAPDAIE
jgi:hypothetical protein